MKFWRPNGREKTIMKKIDGVGWEICKTQGDLYEYAANEGYDMEVFSNAFLASDFCKRAFDTIYSRFQYGEPWDIMYFLLKENPEAFSKYKKENTVFQGDVAYWIGSTYRQLYLITGIESIILKETVSFGAMCRYYPGLHTVDEEMALEIIIKDKSLTF